MIIVFEYCSEDIAIPLEDDDEEEDEDEIEEPFKTQDVQQTTTVKHLPYQIRRHLCNLRYMCKVKCTNLNPVVLFPLIYSALKISSHIFRACNILCVLHNIIHVFFVRLRFN